MAQTRLAADTALAPPLTATFLSLAHFSLIILVVIVRFLGKLSEAHEAVGVVGVVGDELAPQLPSVGCAPDGEGALRAQWRCSGRVWGARRRGSVVGALRFRDVTVIRGG